VMYHELWSVKILADVHKMGKGVKVSCIYFGPGLGEEATAELMT
jgi:hypothetical protein